MTQDGFHDWLYKVQQIIEPYTKRWDDYDWEDLHDANMSPDEAANQYLDENGYLYATPR